MKEENGWVDCVLSVNCMVVNESFGSKNVL